MLLGSGHRRHLCVVPSGTLGWRQASPIQHCNICLELSCGTFSSATNAAGFLLVEGADHRLVCSRSMVARAGRPPGGRPGLNRPRGPGTSTPRPHPPPPPRRRACMQKGRRFRWDSISCSALYRIRTNHMIAEIPQRPSQGISDLFAIC